MQTAALPPSTQKNRDSPSFLWILRHWLSTRMHLAHTIVQTKNVGQHCVSSLLSLFLHRGCPLCDRPGHPVFCLDCGRQLQDTYRLPVSWQTQTETPDSRNHWPISTLGNYDGSLRQVLRALKYNYRPEIATVLGNTFGQQWPTLAPQLKPQRSPANSLSVVPIPLHLNRYRQRGYNQAELIAKAFCRTSGLPLLSHGLVRVEDTLPQHQLGKASRQENLESAFAVGRVLMRSHQPTDVLLMDDIYTTGATMRSAADVLADAGIRVVGVLAVARAVSD